MMFILQSQKPYSKDNFIELFGMPASGKSTYLENVKKENFNVIDVNSTLPKAKISKSVIKIYYIVKLFFKSPVMVIKDTKIILSSKQQTFKDLLIVTANWFLVNSLCSQYSNFRSSKIYVWDQGLFQALWSIFLSSEKYFNAKKLFAGKRLPQNVYFFDEDNSVLKKRAIMRKEFRRFDYSDEMQIFKARNSLNEVLDILQSLDYKKVENSNV